MPNSAVRTKSRYSPHPMLAREKAAKEKLAAESGRTFDEWVDLARRKGPKQESACRQWLREEHGFTSMNSWWIASAAISPENEVDYCDPEALVDALYSGAKARLRPLHERIVDAALALGGDVIATSCKTMVPLYRRHVFAQLRPLDAGVEVSLAIAGVAPSRRFEDIRGRNPGDRLTHRVVVGSEAELDPQFRAALRASYEAGAGTIAKAEKTRTPADLSNALKASPKATATWEASTDAMRRDWIVWIDSAKQAGTRTKRIGQTIGKLAAGKKRMY